MFHWFLGILGYTLLIMTFLLFLFYRKKRKKAILSEILFYLIVSLTFISFHEANIEMHSELKNTVGAFSIKIAREGMAKEEYIHSFYQSLEERGIDKDMVTRLTYPQKKMKYGELIDIQVNISEPPNTILSYLSYWLFHTQRTFKIHNQRIVEQLNNRNI